jgi:hypothetical protein
MWGIVAQKGEREGERKKRRKIFRWVYCCVRRVRLHFCWVYCCVCPPYQATKQCGASTMQLCLKLLDPDWTFAQQLLARLFREVNRTSQITPYSLHPDFRASLGVMALLIGFFLVLGLCREVLLLSCNSTAHGTETNFVQARPHIPRQSLVLFFCNWFKRLHCSSKCCTQNSNNSTYRYVLSYDGPDYN